MRTAALRTGGDAGRNSIGDNAIGGVRDWRKWHAACSINPGDDVRHAVNLLLCCRVIE
jgi:hypothetical protein